VTYFKNDRILALLSVGANQKPICRKRFVKAGICQRFGRHHSGGHT